MIHAWGIQHTHLYTYEISSWQCFSEAESTALPTRNRLCHIQGSNHLLLNFTECPADHVLFFPFISMFIVHVYCTNGILVCSCSSALKYLKAGKKKKKKASHKNLPHVVDDPFLAPAGSGVRYSMLIIWMVHYQNSVLACLRLLYFSFCNIDSGVPGVKGRT